MVLRAPVRWLWPCETAGHESIPTEGPAVLCANHLSFFDSVLLMMTLDRPVHFIGKADYLDSWTTRRLFPAMGMIPVDRDNGLKAMVALDAAADVLRAGGLLCVYPEGTRSRDGFLHRGYVGAARLALATDSPLLPVGIIGTDRIQPPGARLPRLRRCCAVAIGAPVPQAHASSPRRAARELTDALMARIAELSGQEYVATYSRRPARVEQPDEVLLAPAW